jgi:hypothetical protein
VNPACVIAGRHEQSEHTDLQDAELAILQRGAQSPGIACDLVRSRHVVGGQAAEGDHGQVRSRATRPCGPRNTSAARSGDDGVAATAEAASKPRFSV